MLAFIEKTAHKTPTSTAGNKEYSTFKRTLKSQEAKYIGTSKLTRNK